MTEEELEVSKCLDRVFEYCKSHKGTCKGCIFFRYAQLGEVAFTTCKVIYAPEVFNRNQEEGND